ncbi:MAG: polysulfide reductase NrfD [Coriobacteriales bacterium]|jgi:molybdopterin-containing oxidoreductase family membrane subunit|nr:polysulfide reductase NrfD [Coriobacteriales bacterium]
MTTQQEKATAHTAQATHTKAPLDAVTQAKRPRFTRAQLLAGIIALLCLIVGIPSWVIQMTTVQFGEGLVTWGLNIDLFFLSAGIGSSLLAVTGLSLFGVLPGVYAQRKFLSIISFACLFVASWIVFVDAGTPLRVFSIIFSPQFNSLFVWDFYFIALAALISLIILFKREPKRALGCLGIVFGLAVTITEGCVLAVSVGTPHWSLNIGIPILFVLEGMIAALALILLISRVPQEEKRLVNALLALLAAALVVNAVDVLVGAYLGSGIEATTIAVMVVGGLAPLFWGQILLGLLVPLILLAIRRTRVSISCAAVLAIVGVFLGKLMTLLSGQAVLADGTLSTYMPSLLELGACVGYVGFVLLIVLVGMQIVAHRAAQNESVLVSEELA